MTMKIRPYLAAFALLLSLVAAPGLATIDDNAPRNAYTATAGQTAFTYSFEILANTDLKVLQNGTLLALSTDYTVSGVGAQSGGTVTLTSGATNGDTIIVYRDMPVSRTTDYQPGGRLNPDTLDLDVDRVVLGVQQVERDVDRTIKMPVTDTTAVIDMALPGASTRASKFLAFDSLGKVTVSSGTAASTISAGLTTLLDTGGFYASSDVENALAEIASLQRSFGSVTLLKAATARFDGEIVYLTCYYTCTTPDGGEGSFRYDAASTASDNGGTILDPDASGAGRWERIYSGAINVRWFGAKGDGSTDDATAFNAALAISNDIYAPKGRYVLGAPITLDNLVTGSDDPFSPNQYDAGIRLVGDGMNRTHFYAAFSAPAAAGATAQGLINLTASVVSDKRLGAVLQGFTIFPNSAIGGGAITNTHGILINANFFARVEHVRVQSMPGSGIYAPVRTDISSNPDDYQNSVLYVRGSWFNANGLYGVYGESGPGMAATSLENSFFYNNGLSGARIGGVLLHIKNNGFAVNGEDGTLNDVNTCGLLIDALASTNPRNITVENNEFESNFNCNLWVRGASGFVGSNLRLNSQLSPDGGTTLNAPVQVLLGDTGTSVRSARFIANVSKSPPSGTGSSAAIAMYKIRGTDTAQVEIIEPVGIAASDNTSAFVPLDVTTTTGTLDGVRMIRAGIISSTRGHSRSPLLKAYNNASQVVGTGADTTVVFDTEIVDNAAAFASNTYTIPSLGFYKIRCDVRTQSPTTASTVVMRLRRGATALKERRFITTAAAFEHYVIEDVINGATAGDTFTCEINQNTGGDVTLDAGFLHNGLIIERID